MKNNNYHISVIVILLGLGNHVVAGSSELKNKTLSFQTIPSTTYQHVFINNWADDQQPVFCAWIRSPLEWKNVFSPAMTMGNEKPTAPPDSFYDTKQLLVVARVVGGPTQQTNAVGFQAQSVKIKKAILTFNYQFKPDHLESSYQVKSYLMVSLSKKAYASGTVQFIENEKPMCDLNRSE